MEALENEKFLAAEKSSIHGKSYILSVKRAAISLVASELPVSAMMISSTRGLILSRHRFRTDSSSFTIIQRLKVAMASPFFTIIMLSAGRR